MSTPSTASHTPASSRPSSPVLSSHAAENFLRRAETFYKNAQYSLAIQLFHQAEQNGHDSAVMYYRRGWSYYNIDDLENAAKDLKQAADIEPGNWTYTGLYSKVTEGRRKSLGSDMTAEEYMKQKGVSGGHNDGGADSDGDDAADQGRLYDRGVYLAKRGLYIEAVKTFSSAMDAGLHTSASFHARGSALLNKAEDAREMCADRVARKDYEKAISDLTSAMVLGQRTAHMSYERGLAHKRLGNWEEAIEDLTMALEGGLEDGDRYQDECGQRSGKAYPIEERAECYLKKGDYKSCIADYECVIARDPSNTNARWALATARRDIEDDTMKRMEAKMSSNDWYEKGLAQIQSGDYSDAVESFTRAIREGRNGPEAHHHRAVARYNCCQYDEAMKDLQRARKLDENYADHVAEMEGAVYGEFAMWAEGSIAVDQARSDQQIRDLQWSVSMLGLERYKHNLDDARQRKKTIDEEAEARRTGRVRRRRMSREVEVVIAEDGAKEEPSPGRWATIEQEMADEADDSVSLGDNYSWADSWDTLSRTVSSGPSTEAPTPSSGTAPNKESIRFALDKLKVDIEASSNANQALRQQLVESPAMRKLLGDGWENLPTANLAHRRCLSLPVEHADMEKRTLANRSGGSFLDAVSCSDADDSSGGEDLERIPARRAVVSQSNAKQRHSRSDSTLTRGLKMHLRRRNAEAGRLRQVCSNAVSVGRCESVDEEEP